MSHKVELKNGRVAYCETINPIALNGIEARFGSKIKSVAGYDTDTKAEHGTKAGSQYVRDMSNIKSPMYIFNVFVSWSGMVKTSKPGYPSGKKYKDLQKKIELLEYPQPNQYTANFAPLNWVNEKGDRYFETYAEGSNDDYHDDMTESGYVRYNYFFPKAEFTISDAQKLINAEHPSDYGFMLEKHPDLYAYGNKIPNHYKGLEFGNVWNSWSKDQRKHFIHDHFREYLKDKGENALDEYIPLDYNKLPGDLQEEIHEHIEWGQYKKGGRMFKNGGSTEKPNFKELAETNEYGLDEKDLETLFNSGNVEINHWVFFKVGNEWETIYDGLYMEVFSTFEDMLNRENQKAYYEYNEVMTETLGEETFTDENGNVREYGEGGSTGDYFASESNVAEKGKKLGFAYQVGDKVMVNDRGYMKYFSEFDTTQPATILDRVKTKSGGKTYYSYIIQFADGRKPFNNAPQGLLEPVTEKYAGGGVINMNKIVWEGWRVGDFINDMMMFFDMHPKFNSKEEVKKWAMENQPGYKKFIPDVVNYFWAKNETKTEPWEFDKFGLGGDIKKYKDALMKKAKTKGIYEEFGQAELSKLQDKYKYDRSANQWSNKEDWDNKRAMDQFENWILNYDISQFGLGGDTDGKKVGVAKRTNIKNWYTKNYPTDDLGKEINSERNFWQLWTMMSQGYNPYEFLDVYDSVVRERVMEKLSEILGVDYDVVYKTWLRSSKFAEGGATGYKVGDEVSFYNSYAKGDREGIITRILPNNQFDISTDYAQSLVDLKDIHGLVAEKPRKKFLGIFKEGGQTDIFDEEIATMVDETPDMTETKTKYRAEVGATGENTWSSNSMEYDTEDEAKNWLRGLASRWFGYNVSRVVPVSTPKGQTIDLTNDFLFQNYRMKKGGMTFPIWRKQKYAGGGSTKLPKYVVIYVSKETGGMRERVFDNEKDANDFSNSVNGSVAMIKNYAGGGGVGSFDWSNMSFNEKVSLAQESGLENPTKVAITEVGMLTPSQVSALKNSVRLNKESKQKFAGGGKSDYVFKANVDNVKEFIKTLEKSKMFAKNSHNNSELISTIQSIVSMSKEQFDDYIKENPNNNVMMIFDEYNDWMQSSVGRK